jgi:CDP-diacylglycerol--serine O-phosphatidyltransferase
MPKLRFTLVPVERVDRRPSRVAYALPTLFTAGNIFLGFLAIMRAFEGAIAAKAGALGPNDDLSAAAKMIGVAVLLDGLDGRIARMTNTVSDFGREMDSLADAITFGLAPAVLAFAWGVLCVDTSGHQFWRQHLYNAGYFVAFMFLLCGTLRLARFNIQTNPTPKNPGRPDRKYFVGLPIPAGAGMVAAVVHATDSTPLQLWPLSLMWLALLMLLGFLMVSTWRYYSFKDLNLLSPRSPLTFIVAGAFVFLVWNYSQPVLLALAVAYVGSGIVIRIGGILRRTYRRLHPAEASS